MNNLIHLKAIDDIPLQDVHVSDIVKLNEDVENGNFEVLSSIEMITTYSTMEN